MSANPEPQHNPPSNPRDVIRQGWQAAAPLWKKWYPQLKSQSRPATNLILEGARLSPGHHVLDLASGSGEPSLSVAGVVAPHGRVTATDLLVEMLDLAREHAAAKGITNIEFREADAEQLPFPDHHFDRVTCRFGIMFFPDIPKAFGEIRRVLKPGGRISFVTWGPMEENPLFGLMITPFLKHVDVPPPPPDAPHVFRFADEKKLVGTLGAARFRDVDVRKHHVPWSWPDYEGATFIADMNKPLTPTRQYDTVIDYGSLKHVYNVPQGFANVSRLCRKGGRVVHVSPSNNFCGHGFWQFSPELFFSLYSAANCYSETEVFLADVTSLDSWFKVDPPSNGKRAEAVSSTPLHVMCKARKMSDACTSEVQQSDYVHAWKGDQNTKSEAVSGVKKFVRSKPGLLRGVWAVRGRLHRLKNPTSLSDRNPHLKKLAVADLLAGPSMRRPVPVKSALLFP